MSLHSLAPWEIPPDSDIPVSAPAYTRVLVPFAKSQRVMSVRLVKFTPDAQLVFVRAEGDSEAGNWVLMPFRHSNYDKTTPTRMSKQVHYEFLSKYLDKHHFARFYTWPSDDKRPVRFVLITATHAMWLNFNFRVLAEFKLEQANFGSILDLSSRRMKLELESEMANPTSDARFSYEWANMNKLEKRIVLCDKLTDEETFNLVAKWLLQSTVWIWDIGTAWLWSISRYRDDLIWIIEENIGKNYAWPDENDRRFEFFLRWQKWLINKFDPFHKERANLLQNHRCIRRDYGSMGYFNFIHEIKSGIPTIEERLEAKINLQNWAKAHLSSQEIALLLPDGF